jgi:hypothetical protein
LEGEQRFVWEWDHQPLPDDYYYDLRIWSEKEKDLDPGARRGAVTPTKKLEAKVDLARVPAIAEYGEGIYYWSVVVVHKACFDDLKCPTTLAGDWAEEREFRYDVSKRDPGKDKERD